MRLFCSIAVSWLQADQEPGTSYLEATPRGRPADAPHAPQRPAAPAGTMAEENQLFVEEDGHLLSLI